MGCSALTARGSADLPLAELLTLPILATIKSLAGIADVLMLEVDELLLF